MERIPGNESDQRCVARIGKTIGKYAFNDTALTLYIEREQGDIPSGWDENWDSTYAANPIEIVWGASPSDVQG